MTARRWEVRLGGRAELDFASILRWTAERFEARAYRQVLLQAIRALAAGPEIVGSRTRDELAPGWRSLPVARGGRRARHLLFYRAIGDQRIEILRILHDGMDPNRHLPP